MCCINRNLLYRELNIIQNIENRITLRESTFVDWTLVLHEIYALIANLVFMLSVK